MALNNFLTPENIIFIIIAAIALIAVVLVVIQWRKVKISEHDLAVLEKQIELKKITMVEKDMESKRLMETGLPLAKDKQEKLTELRKNTSELLNDVGYMQTQVSERLARLEAQTELTKLQKMLAEIEDKEKRLNKTSQKYKGE